MKSSRYFLDCVINDKLTISFVLKQQKYVTDAANIHADLAF